MFLVNFLIASSAIAGVSAWNADIHHQIGFMADEFLTPEVSRIVEAILEPQYHGSLGEAASWADDYRREEFTHSWHSIGSLDNPPLVCNTYYNRDCTKDGCLVSAITQQTMILRDCITKAKVKAIQHGNNITCANALKYITHFISDIHQPLHTTKQGAGGNDHKVSFGGMKNNSNLHSIWDGPIVYYHAYVQSFSFYTISPYFSALAKRVKKDDFPVPRDDWELCMDPSIPLSCAMHWASETNSLNCDYVYSQDFGAEDLSTSGYFEGAYPIIDIQLSKAAYRLAMWLNYLVQGMYNKEREVSVRVSPAWKEL